MAVTSGSSTGYSWSHFPPELLGLVLSRLPSHADRVRIAAVCLPWRFSVELLQPLPPLLPWLALCDGSFVSLPDGAVHRLPVADDVVSRVSTGSMLVQVHGDDTCSLLNPSPVRTTTLPELAVCLRRNSIVEKVVVSDQLVAALVKVKTFCNNWTTTQVVTSTRGQQWDITRCSTTEWQAPEACYTADDIALFKGKLYILTTDVEHYQPELHVLDAGGQEYTTIRGIPRADGDYGDYDGACYNPYSTDSYSYVRRNYLVVSDNQLLMVERRIYQPPMFQTDPGIEERTRLFKVFEAADLGSGSGRWTEVDTLMGRALFVSQGCSESLPAVAQCGSIGVREDCIYFMNNNGDKYADMFNKKIHVNPFLDSGVYNMRDRTTRPLLSEMAVTPVAGDGPWCPTWLFPET